MTEQEVRRFFYNLRRMTRLRQSMLRIKDRTLHDMSQLRAVRYDATKVSGGTESDISRILIAVEAKEEENTRTIARLSMEIADAKAEAFTLIGHCDTPMQKAVIIDRWLNDLSWEQMEQMHHYSSRHLERFEAAGIAAIARATGGAVTQNGNVPRRRLKQIDDSQEMSLFSEYEE